MSFNEKSDSSIQDSMGYLKLTNGIKQLNGEKNKWQKYIQTESVMKLFGKM